ncbi:MAG: DUF3108 domain-containing protein, partial [Pontiella sp.]
AGRSTLEVLPDEELNGEKVRSFQMTIKSAKVLDAFYKVRDNITSLASYDISHSLGYSKIQREGRVKRDISVDFDWETQHARYTESIAGDSHIIPVTENALDPLSVIYYIRNQKLEVGSVIKGPLTDGLKCSVAQIRVMERDWIKVNGKKYDALKLVPDLNNVSGVFEKEKNAPVEFWVTADHRHIPVLFKSKVKIGSFKVELKTQG